MVLEADKDCLIGLLPFYHIYGMVVVQFGSLTQGAKLVVVPKFEQEMFLSAIQEHRVITCCVIYIFFCKIARSSQYKISPHNR